MGKHRMPLWHFLCVFALFTLLANFARYLIIYGGSGPIYRQLKGIPLATLVSKHYTCIVQQLW